MGKLAFCRIKSFAILLLLLQVCHAMITCNVPTVPAGHNATLTCDFRTNMADEKKKVFVDHHVKNKADTWISCYHDADKDKHICITINKQVISGEISGNSLSLIFQASNETVGDFSCQIEGGGTYETCAFQLTRDSRRGDGDGGGKGSGGGGGLGGGAIAAIVIAVLIAVIALVVCIVWCWKKNKLCFAKEKLSPDPKPDPIILPLISVSPPEDIKIKKEGDTIHISWSPSKSDRAIGYEIYCVDDKNKAYNQKTDGQTCSVDIHVDPERTYTIKLATRTAQSVGEGSKEFIVENSGAEPGEAKRTH